MAYLNKTPKHMRSGPFSAAKFVNETCDALVYAGGLVFLLIRPFALQTFYVPSGSMLETLQLNDFLIGNKWVYRMSDPKPGEIIIFRPPTEALDPTEGDKYVSNRMVGAPGDVVECKGGELNRHVCQCR